MLVVWKRLEKLNSCFWNFESVSGEILRFKFEHCHAMSLVFSFVFPSLFPWSQFIFFIILSPYYSWPLGFRLTRLSLICSFIGQNVNILLELLSGLLILTLPGIQLVPSMGPTPLYIVTPNALLHLRKVHCSCSEKKIVKKFLSSLHFE